MNSVFKKLSIPEVILIEPKIFSDNRGFFFENFKENLLNKSFFENEKLIIVNRVSEKIEQTLIKRSSLPGANFNNQQVLDLMESSWGEKFTKVLRNAVSNGLNKVDLNLNPKHLGKIVLEISSGSAHRLSGVLLKVQL